MTDFTPREIVSELDRYIIGQKDAKRAVAIALRNRWRRRQLSSEIRDEVLPRNILMIGPTGVGKTEIARRLAKLANAPFIKVEATKFTEVGYVGRDVEQIVRDLIETSIHITRKAMHKKVHQKAQAAAEERVLNALVGDNTSDETRQHFRKLLREGALDKREIEFEVRQRSNTNMPTIDIPGMPGAQMGMLNINDLIGDAFGSRKKKIKTTVADSHSILLEEESDLLLDEDKVIKEAIKVTENNGIVFLDEIDKITGRARSSSSGEVSREGVQRDLLPLLEGTTVSTKYGPVQTDHILFIASGAFHTSRPADMLPELQGRLPIRVELRALDKNDFKRILTETEANLIRQYHALMAVEGLELTFTGNAIDEIASIAVQINTSVENIGARRLQTVMEKLLEDISFEASEKDDEKIEINQEDVQEKLSELLKTTDLSNFIL